MCVCVAASDVELMFDEDVEDVEDDAVMHEDGEEDMDMDGTGEDTAEQPSAMGDDES